jgi:hypothetical protein
MATATGTITTREIEQSREADEELKKETLSLHDQIRQRAHEIWLARDGNGGSELTDWLEAENEISSK